MGLLALSLLCGADAAQQPADSFIMTLEAGEHRLGRADTGDHTLEAQDCRTSGLPGAPALPSRALRLLVPPDADPASVRLDVVDSRIEELPGAYSLAPAPPVLAVGQGGAARFGLKDTSIVNGRDMGIYGVDAFHPASHVDIISGGRMRKWQFVAVRFRPFRYNPVSGVLARCSEVTFRVSYARDAKRNANIVASGLMADTAMDHSAAALFDNFETAAEWYPPVRREGLVSRDLADYVIITRNVLVQSSSLLQSFINHKEARGHHVLVVTEDDFDGLTGQAPNERPEKIRQWLIDNYVALGIQYVLLIGEPTSVWNTDRDIPMKRCYPMLHSDEPGIGSSDTDYFYADLTGNWNLDGDEYFGVVPDDFNGTGVDFAAEVWVGRLPVYNIDGVNLDAILQKIMNYEAQSSIDWRKSALLPHNFVDAETDGAHVSEQAYDDYLRPRGYSVWRMYCQGSFAAEWDSVFASEQELLPGTGLRDRWAARDDGIMFWSGHGGPNSVSFCYESYSDPIFSVSYAAALDNAHPSICYLCSCGNGYPLAENNMGTAILRHGGVGVVCAADSAWYLQGRTYGNFDGVADAFGIGYEFFERVTQNRPLGRALYDTTFAVTPNAAGHMKLTMNLMTLNLYGCPATAIDSGAMTYRIYDDTPKEFSTIPQGFSFSVFDHDWAFVGIAPSTDHNLLTDDNSDFGSPSELSIASGTARDFIAVNAHLLSSGTYYAKVFGGTQSVYVIEAEYDVEDLQLGVDLGDSVSSNEVFQTYEVELTAGRQYVVFLDVLSRMADLNVYMFVPSRSTGDRSEYDYRSVLGRTGDETIALTAPLDGAYGIAVVNEDGGNATYTISVTDVTPMAAPTGVTASDGIHTSQIHVAWNPVAEASHYQVHRGPASGDFAAATPVSGWVTNLTYVGSSDIAGFPYRYWVTAAADETGYREGQPGTPDTGYTTYLSLSDDAVQLTATEPAHYDFDDGNPHWCAVGVRPVNTNDNWSLMLFADGACQSSLASSTYGHDVDFVVIDRGHVATVDRYVKASGFGATGPAHVEFEGGNETLSAGTNSSINWPEPTATDVVEIWDVALARGTYDVSLRFNSGDADLGLAVYGTGDGNFYRDRQEYMGMADNGGAGSNEQCCVSIASNDVYGLCVWANDTNAANFDIVIEPLVIGLWEGDESEDWHTAGNWIDDAVPNASTDATIPPGTPNVPFVRSGGAACDYLAIHPGAELHVECDGLNVHGKMTVHGELALGAGTSRVDVAGDVVWAGGSTADFGHSDARLNVQGDWTFETGASFQMERGTVQFEGTGNSAIISHDPDCRFYGLRNSKTGGGVTTISADSAEGLRLHTLQNYHALVVASPHPVVVEGAWDNHGAGAVYASAGTVVLDYQAPTAIPFWAGVGGFFGNVVVSSLEPVSVGGAYISLLDVRGDLVIEQGGLKAGVVDILLGGDWSNGVGVAGFDPGTATVRFAGSGAHQNVIGDTAFYALADARSGKVGWLDLYDAITVSNDFVLAYGARAYGALTVEGMLNLDAGGSSLLVQSGAVVTAESLDLGGRLGCYGGTLTANDLADPGLFGVIEMHGGRMDLHQDVQRIDLNGDLTITNGILAIHGGSDVSRWSYGGDASLSMHGGVLDVVDRGIRIDQTAWSFTADVSAGRIRSGAGFSVARNGFAPTGGVIELRGATAGELDCVAASSLYHLLVNKDGANVAGASDLDIRGDFLLRSGTFVAPESMWIGGNWSNGVGSAAFQEEKSLVTFAGSDAGDILTDETFYDVALEKKYTESDGLEVAAGRTVQVSHNLNLVKGAMKLGGNATLDVASDIAIGLEAGLNAVEGGTSVKVGGSWNDANSSFGDAHGFNPGYGSTVTFDRAKHAALDTACEQATFAHLVVDRGGGSVVVADSVRVRGDWTISNGTWSASVPHLAHYVGGNFDADATAAWGDGSTGCTLVCEGSVDQALSIESAGSPANIVVSNDSHTVRLLSDVSATGDLGVRSGTLSLNGKHYAGQGDVTVADGGDLVLSAGSRLGVGNGHGLVVESGGRLTAVGAAGAPATIAVVPPAAGTYGFVIQSNATVAAAYASIENTDSKGIQVEAGGVIDPASPFNHCSFDSGAAGGAYLSIGNVQDLSLYDVAFPSDPGGGAVNVRKTLDAGRLTFVGATGAFAGETYDNDAYDRVDWESGAMLALGLTGPLDVTRGGQYGFSAAVTPGDCTIPVTYTWQVSDKTNRVNSSDERDDSAQFAWATPGAKTLQVTAVNSAGAVTDSISVVVHDLAFSGIACRTGLVELAVSGTCTVSTYCVQYCTNLANPLWLTVDPTADHIPGQGATTVWTDQSYSNRNGTTYYRVFVETEGVMGKK